MTEVATAPRTPPFTEAAPRLSSGLQLKRERVIAVAEDLPETFTLDNLVDRLIHLAKLDERIKEADKGETIPHEEVMARLRSRRAGKGL